MKVLFLVILPIAGHGDNLTSLCNSCPDLLLYSQPGNRLGLVFTGFAVQGCCCLREPLRAFLGQAGCRLGCSSRAAEAGVEGDSQGNQKQARKSCWGKPAINPTLQRKSGSPGNPPQLLPLPHAARCIRASCTAEDRSMSFSMPCLSSRLVPSHTSVSRLPAPCKLHSPRIPAARDTPLLPLPYPAQLRPRSRGSHTQISGCCALFQVSIFSRGRRTFITQQNAPRCLLP